MLGSKLILILLLLLSCKHRTNNSSLDSKKLSNCGPTDYLLKLSDKEYICALSYTAPTAKKEQIGKAYCSYINYPDCDKKEQQLKMYDIIKSLGNKVFTGQYPYSLTEIEVMSIYKYTKNFDIAMDKYLTINDETQIYEPVIKIMIGALNKIPPKKTTLYSGALYPHNDFTNKHTVNNPYSRKGFFSTSADIKIAEKFIYNFSAEKETAVIYVIEGTNGRKISDFSAYPHEMEFVYHPSFPFKITNIEKKQYRGALTNFVYLEEQLRQ